MTGDPGRPGDSALAVNICNPAGVRRGVNRQEGGKCAQGYGLM